MDEDEARSNADKIIIEMIKAGVMNGHTALDRDMGERHADYLKAIHKGLIEHYMSFPTQ